MKEFTEGSCKLTVAGDFAKPTKKLDVFYNPVMKHNRDVAVALLHSMLSKKKKDSFTVALPLEASGVRGIRMICEIPFDFHVYLNDIDESAIESMKKHMKINKVAVDRYTISQKSADEFLLTSRGFDYIDIDPFGSPNPFLDAAVKRIHKGGILAVTATDTAPLCGTYHDACVRKYYAVPLRTPLMFEVGARILIRKVQLIGMQYDKALIPVLTYCKDHYFRIYFVAKSGKKLCDEIVSQYGYICEGKDLSITIHKTQVSDCAGPLYLGRLWNFEYIDEKTFAKCMADDPKWLEMLLTEMNVSAVGYYHIPTLCSLYKVKKEPSFIQLMESVRDAGYSACRTLFHPQGIRTNMPFEKFLKLIR